MDPPIRINPSFLNNNTTINLKRQIRMKNLYASLKAIVCLAALTALGCTQPAENSWLQLDRAEATLPSTGETSLTINVDASSSNWTVTPEATWVTVSEQTANTVVLTAGENDNIERSTQVVFSLGDTKTALTIHQLERSGLPSHFRKFDEYHDAAISPSGKTITAMRGGSEGGSFVYSVYLVDVATDARTFVGKYAYELSAPFCVTDDGSMMFYANAWVNTAVMEPDGTDLILSYPELGLGTPRISCVSTDGRIWGGYFDGSADGAVPYRFVDGVPTDRLEVPDTNFRGAPRKKGDTAGFQLRGGSADGSMFYGTSWDNFDYGMCYWDKEGKFHWVGGDRHKTSTHETVDKYGNPKTVYCVDWGVQCQSELYKMSPNGKYIGCMIYQETFDEAQGAALGSTTGCAVYDTETDELIMMPSGATVMSITNSGLAVIADSAPIGSTTIYDLNAGAVLGDSADWVLENFGIDISNTGCFVTGIFGENDDVVFGNYMPAGMMVYNFWYAAKNK